MGAIHHEKKKRNHLHCSTCEIVQFELNLRTSIDVFDVIESPSRRIVAAERYILNLFW